MKYPLTIILLLGLLLFFPPPLQVNAQVLTQESDETRYVDPAGLFSVLIPTLWTAEEAEGHGILSNPEGNLVAYVIAVEATSMAEGAQIAWTVIDPTFELEPIQIIQAPTTRGEDEAVAIVYNTGDANEIVIARGWLYRNVAYLEIFRGDTITFQEQIVQVRIIIDSYDIFATVDEFGFTSRRNMLINLGDGVETVAQLTFPSGDGPFPGVLLIHGSGETDMDEFIPALVTAEPTRLFLQIAEYLGERGYSVLRYNKRGVGLGGGVADIDTFLNKTYFEQESDALKALQVLMQQPEVDNTEITIIGHSEGTIIAPRIAIDHPEVKNLVLLGTIAENLRDLLFYQFVDRRIQYLEEIVDTNDDGLLSIEEVASTLENPLVSLSPVPPETLLNPESGFTEWFPGPDLNEDGFINLEEELEPFLTQVFDILHTFTYKERGGVTLDLARQNPFDNPWFEEHFGLEPTMEIIGDVSANILIMQGEGDTLAPLDQAFLLEESLANSNHPHHTVITYPGLGHTFYPIPAPWIEPFGPIQEEVLSDLASWLMSDGGLEEAHELVLLAHPQWRRRPHILTFEFSTPTGNVDYYRIQFIDGPDHSRNGASFVSVRVN